LQRLRHVFWRSSGKLAQLAGVGGTAQLRGAAARRNRVGQPPGATTLDSRTQHW
jgi:hypothetical protein